MAPAGGRRGARSPLSAPTLAAFAVLAAFALLAGCQAAPFDGASSEVPSVTPAAIPDDPAPTPSRAGSETAPGPDGSNGRPDQELSFDASDDVVIRNDRNVTFVVELYVDPGGTDAVDVTFVNGTTVRLDESTDGVTGVNGSYRPFDPDELAGAATVVRPADPDAVILPLTARPGETVRGDLPPLAPSDTVLYTVRTYPTRPGRPNTVRWVGVLGCPTGYLGLTDTIAFDFHPDTAGVVDVERECTAPP